MNVLPVLLAAALAFAAWILQRALHRADEQRRIASRMRAYLIFWQKRALVWGAWKVLNIGEEWYAEDQTIKRSGSNGRDLAQKLVDSENKHQASLREQISAELDKQKPDFAGMLESHKLLDKMHERSPTLRKEVIEQLLQSRNELIAGSTFVTDADVAVLDATAVTATVELRLTLAALLENSVGVLQYVDILDEKPMVESLKKQIVEAILAGVRVGYSMKLLSERCHYYLLRPKMAGIRSNLFV